MFQLQSMCPCQICMTLSSSICLCLFCLSCCLSVSYLISLFVCLPAYVSVCLPACLALAFHTCTRMCVTSCIALSFMSYVFLCIYTWFPATVTNSIIQVMDDFSFPLSGRQHSLWKRFAAKHCECAAWIFQRVQSAKGGWLVLFDVGWCLLIMLAVVRIFFGWSPKDPFKLCWEFCKATSWIFWKPFSLWAWS